MSMKFMEANVTLVMLCFWPCLEYCCHLWDGSAKNQLGLKTLLKCELEVEVMTKMLAFKRRVCAGITQFNSSGPILSSGYKT